MTLKRPPDGGRPGRPEGSSSAMETNPTGGTAVFEFRSATEEERSWRLGSEEGTPRSSFSHTFLHLIYMYIYIRGTFVAMKCGHLTFPLWEVIEGTRIISIDKMASVNLNWIHPLRSDQYDCCVINSRQKLWLIDFCSLYYADWYCDWWDSLSSEDDWLVGLGLRTVALHNIYFFIF